MHTSAPTDLSAPIFLARNSLAMLVVVAWFGLAAPTKVWGKNELAKIINYREYSATLSSAGQPERKQLEALRETGFERVIFLAFTDHENSVPGEDRIVTELGMDYVHIPVVWESPNRADFEAFAAVMREDPGKKTLVHCQVNFRASAFAFLYRVLFDGVPIEQAKEDMNSVWVPNETWREFIFMTLEANGVSPHCDLCLWQED